jgi:hypothetical protein
MALGSTQPLAEMNTSNLPGGKGRAAREADNLTAFCEPVVYKMWELRRLTTLWHVTEIALPFFLMTGSLLNSCVSTQRSSRSKF